MSKYHRPAVRRRALSSHALAVAVEQALHASPVRGRATAMLVLALAAPMVQAQSTDWRGPSDPPYSGFVNWHNGANWTAGPPDASIDANIANGGTAYISLTEAAARDLRIGFGNIILFDTLSTRAAAIENGTAFIDGGHWNTEQLSVGVSGPELGRTIIRLGGTVNANAVEIGVDAGSTGAMTVDGVGSTLDADTLTVGRSGTGALHVTDGASVANRGSLLVIGMDVGSNGTVAVDGVGSHLVSNPEIVVGNEGEGLLTISGGARVESGPDVQMLDTAGIRIGNEVGSTGAATVTGAGSMLYMANDAYIGNRGAGSLEILDGGAVTNYHGLIGAFGEDGVGSVRVDGAGSTWNNGGSLRVGYHGTGTMTVSNGAVVNSNDGFLGYAGTAAGSVLVEGAGSVWNSANAISVGESGTGSMTLRNGGAVVSGGVAIGGTPTGQGEVVVEGAGSHWDTTWISVGGPNVGSRLTIRDGGQINAGSATVGQWLVASGTLYLGDGSVDVQGSGSRWNIAGRLDVGVSGGTITIADGAALNSGDTFIGNLYSTRFATISGKEAWVLVDGADSLWTSTGTITAGIDGNGTLAVRNGGNVDSQGGILGLNARSTEGAALIEGAGSQWRVAGTLTVGAAGQGVLEVASGGALISQGALLGEQAGSAGHVVVDGAGSGWRGGEQLLIGGAGAGSLTIRDGATAESRIASLGLNAGGSGVLSVQGAGSLWTSGLNLTVGMQGEGAVDIVDGGRVQTVDLMVGFDDGSHGTVHVDGTDSRLDATAGAYVGWFGQGEMIVENAGTVITGQGYLGQNATGIGRALVDGIGSLWSVTTSPLRVGGSGDGELTVTGGGRVSAALGMDLARDASSTAIVNVGNGGAAGLLDTSRITGGLGSATINFNHNDNIEFGASMTGSLTINKLGGGTTALTADSTYAGRTTIQAGTLQLGNGGTAGGIVGDIINNASLVIDRGNTYTYAGTISGNGRVSQAGSGTTVFTADHTYTGGTFIGAGTLQLGDGGDSGGIVGDITNNASLVIDRGNVFAYAGTIGGTGIVRQAGTGTSIFTGEHSYTGGTFVDAGTLRIGDGGTRGSLVGDVAIASGAGFVFDRSDSFGFDGAFAGGGTLDKFGAGTLTLTGSSGAFVGHGSIHAGGLHMLGTIGGQVDILHDAWLSGTGTLGSVDNAGTISPGGSIGTLHMTGDYLHRVGATYLVDIEPNGTSDLLDVVGHAAIEGGEVSVAKTPGFYRGGMRYTIVDADGGVVGTFDALEQNLPFLDLVLTYDPNHVYLDVLRNDTDFSSLCGVGTFNQCQVAGALDRISDKPVVSPDLQTVIGEVTTLDTEAALASFDRMSGEAHASLAGLMLEGHALFGQTVTRRIAERREAEGATRLQGGAWVRAYGANADLDGDGNAYGADYNLQGLAVGYDAWGAENWLIGASANVMTVDADFRPGDKAKADAKNVSIYSSYQGERAYLDGVASFAWWNSDVTRAVDVGTIHRTAESDYGSNRLAVYLEGGWKIAVADNMALQPFATFQRDVYDVQAFREHGAQDVDIVSHSQGGERSTAGVGLRWSGAFKRGDWMIEPSAQARWLHTMGDRTVQFELAYAGARDVAYLVRGATFPENRGVLGFGLAARKENIDLFVDYDYQSGDGFKAHNLGAGLRYRW